MKKIMMFAFAAALSAVPAFAQEKNMPLYPESATLYLNFDNTVDAALAKGRAKPIQSLGKTVFRKGLRGEALLCGKGGSMQLYLRNKNMDLTKPGTLLFFYQPIDWEKSKFNGGSFFCGIQARKGALYFNVAHDPAKLCPCRRPVTLNFFNGVKIPAQLYPYYPQFEQSKCAQWHMLAFSWEPGKLQISQDGKAWKEYPVPFTITAEDFPNPAFCIGESSKWNYLLDEFTVYNRVLSSKELTEVYQHMIK